MKKIAVIPGDGIGPEVIREGVKVLETVSGLRGIPIDFMWYDFGAERYLRDGVTLPQAAFEDFRDRFAAIYLGALGDPRVPDMVHARDILLGLRFRLDLYINLRPVKLLAPRLTPLRHKSLTDLDLVIFRENTEGLYAGVGGNFKMDTPDEVAITEMLCTRKGVERIIRAAFDHAKAEGLRRVCMSDKSNAITHAHGLWQRVFRQVSSEYPGIESRHLYADVLAMELVRAPEDFDVIVTSNLFGDVLSDLGAQLVGGLGLAPSANLHPGRIGLFEPVHGSAPTLTGTDTANPLAAITTGALMLEQLGYPEEAALITKAVCTALERGLVTRDLDGNLGTKACGDAICELLLQG